MSTVKRAWGASVVAAVGLAAYILASPPAGRLGGTEEQVPAAEGAARSEPFRVGVGVGVRVRVPPLADDPLNLDFK